MEQIFYIIVLRVLFCAASDDTCKGADDGRARRLDNGTLIELMNEFFMTSYSLALIN